MNLKYLIAALSTVVASSAYSASFSHKGETITSSTTVKTIDCGNYTIDLNHEAFSFDYENHIPSNFKIKGFYGSITTISKQAVIQPTGIIIPSPNNLTELKDLYPKDRTYLAGSAVCSGNKIIVSYWSGGNCSQCEAFVAFDISGSKLLNPAKATYSHFKAISK